MSDLKKLFSQYTKKPDKNKAHAVLSASGAERWLGCPGSIRESEGIPSVENDASIRGTNTHTLLQFILENENWSHLLNTVEGVRFRMAIGYDGQMLKNAVYAAKHVFKVKAQMEQRYGCDVKLLTEQKVELESVGFGTSDVILHHPYGVLHVMDYKNGTKVVDPENNWQALYYANAAADKFSWEFSELHVTIIQPNAAHSRGQIRTWVTDEKTLLRARNVLQKGAALTKKKNAPLVKNDSWCWFCPARQTCPLHREEKTAKLVQRFNEVEV